MISKTFSQNLAKFPPIIGGMDLVIYLHIHFEYNLFAMLATSTMA
jgi:hypothetical protein